MSPERSDSALTARSSLQSPSGLEYPLNMWDEEVEQLTKLSLVQDVLPVYNMIKSRAKSNKSFLDFA